MADAAGALARAAPRARLGPANEIKWHGIRTGYVPPALADAVVDALARAPVTAYVVLLDLEAGAALPDLRDARADATAPR